MRKKTFSWFNKVLFMLKTRCWVKKYINKNYRFSQNLKNFALSHEEK